MSELVGVTIEVQGATKRFGQKTALDGVSLDVPAGSFTVLLGPSGSGKTTLLRCLAGIERLTEGRILIGNRLVADATGHRPPEKRDLAMVFQDYALWPHLSAAKNVEFALKRRSLGRSETTHKVGQMLARVGLEHLAHRYPNELSGGEQQRVALARALVGNTGVLLFDEPLSNLDADLRERLRIEIATLTRESGATCVYITHDQSEAFALADQIGVLSQGHLVQVASPENVYHHPATPFVARFTGLAGEVDVVVEGPASVDGNGAATEGELAVRPAGFDAGDAQPILAHVPDAEDQSQVVDHLPRGTRATLLVRPAAVRLLPPGHPDRNTDAMILDAAYRGRGYDHAILLPDGTQLIGVHDEQRWSRGDNVAASLQPSGCLLFAAASDASEAVRIPA